MLRNRPEALVRLYSSLEAFAQSLEPIETVARERYVLLRSVRTFADLVVMAGALRVAVHLRRKVDDPLFGRSCVLGSAELMRQDSAWPSRRSILPPSLPTKSSS